MAESRSTAPPDVPIQRIRALRLVRRLFYLLICGVLLAALLGRLGVHSRSVDAAGGGYELTVAYDDITRGGLPFTFDIEIRRAGGFGDEVVLSIASAYFGFLDQNALSPEPVRTTSNAELEIVTFEPPSDGDTMTVSLDARVQPGIQLERFKGTVSVVEGGRAVATASFSTLVLP